MGEEEAEPRETETSGAEAREDGTSGETARESETSGAAAAPADAVFEASGKVSGPENKDFAEARTEPLKFETSGAAAREAEALSSEISDSSLSKRASTDIKEESVSGMDIRSSAISISALLSELHAMEANAP